MRRALSIQCATLFAGTLACSTQEEAPAPAVPASQPASASSLPSDHSTSTTAVSLESLFAPPEDLPDVVAKVEARKVTRDAFIHELRQMQVQLSATGLPSGLTRDQVLTGALVRTVDHQLQEELAAELEIERDPKAEAIWLEEMNARIKADPAFSAFLLQAGKDATQRKVDARRQVQLAGIMAKVRDGAKADLRDEARAYYDRHPGDYTERAGTEVWRIFIKAPRGMLQRDRDIARSRAEELHARARKKPKQFRNFAISNSEGGKAASGGYLGFVPEGALASELYERVRKAKAGTILPLWEDASGFAIVKVGKSRKERSIPFEEVASSIVDKVYGPFIRREVDTRIRALRAAKQVKVLVPGLRYDPRG